MDGSMTGTGTAQKMLVTMLLDESGSMMPIRDETLGALNEYFGTLRESPADIRATLVKFDSDGDEGMRLDKLFDCAPMAEIPQLGHAHYEPRGMTPLIDASCRTIRAVADATRGKSIDRIVFCIQTDGHENASRENTWVGLKTLIQEKQAEGWEFLFMGCGIDAYDQGRQMGLGDERIVAYAREASRRNFSVMARKTRRLAEGDALDMVLSDAEKSEIGDRFRPRR